MTRCHACTLPRVCDMLVCCRGLIKKKSHGERLLQSIMFSRKNYKHNFRKKHKKIKGKKIM